MPTEIEWEYAARGGHKQKQYMYSGSNNADEVAWFFKAAGCIPVNRNGHDSEAKDAATEVLQSGGALGIFPEGTINRTEDIIMPFKFGAVKMASETHTPIIPFAITGKYKPFERNVKIQFLEPITVSDNLEEANEKLMKIVSEELMKAGVTK